jgi:hypothetical protein
MYMASQIWRYNVTRDPQALAQAEKAFEALLRLYRVTGIQGFMARTVVSIESYAQFSDPPWQNSTVPGFEQWIWKAGTSSDDVISFYFGVPLYIDFVCGIAQNNNETCREIALSMLVNTTDYILANNYYLIDVDGKHTKWGFWGPSELNDNPLRYGERGTNSIEMLGMLAICYHYTHNETYLQQIQILGIDNQYFMNARNSRQIYPEEINYSDDELQYFGLFAYLYHAESLP